VILIIKMYLMSKNTKSIVLPPPSRRGFTQGHISFLHLSYYPVGSARSKGHSHFKLRTRRFSRDLSSRNVTFYFRCVDLFLSPHRK